jgi:hypothetical protein
MSYHNSRTLTKDHPQWNEFCHRLGARLAPPGSPGTQCQHGHEQSRRVLEEMGFDPEPTLRYFAENGGSCDCGVMFNIVFQDDDVTQPPR